MNEQREVDFGSATTAHDRPVQFRLRSLLLFTGLCAAIFGICQWLDLGKGTAIFAIAFFSVAAVINMLTGASKQGLVAVHDTAAEDGAYLCRNHLCENDVSAMVQSNELLGFTGLAQNVFHVVVPAAQVERAHEVLAAHPVFSKAAQHAEDLDD